MILDGGCLCGDVRYSVECEHMPTTYACHCTDCHTQSGSAFGLQMPVTAEMIYFTGIMREGKRKMPSGAAGSIYACETCATRIYVANSSRPGLIILRAGTLDDSQDLVPRAHLWTKSKLAWVNIPDDAIALETQPASPEEWQGILFPAR